jgi:hypothetical protein
LGRYDPLRAHLARQPSDVHELTMTFGQVEQLVGQLPQSARRGKAWWTAALAGSAKAAQTPPTWRVREVIPATRTVIFVRDGAGAIHASAADAAPGTPDRHLSSRALATDVVIGLLAAAVAGATTLAGLTHLPLPAIVLLSVAIGGLSFTITQAVNSRKVAEASRVWWAGSTVLALTLCVGGLSYHEWFDPATHPPAIPFTFSVLVDPPTVVDGSCRPIVRPGPWDHVPAPQEPLTPTAINSWVRSQHGVDGKFTAVVLELQGRSSQAVVINQPLIVVRSRQAPIRGSVAELSGGCGSLVQHRIFDVNLDQQSPVTDLVAGAPYPDLYHKNKTWPEVSSASFEISATDPEYLVILASTTDALCRWSVDLTWASDGKTGTIAINDGTGPFVTTALGNDPAHLLVLGAWESPPGPGRS